MSFGIGVGDIIVLTKLATETYRACKHSTGEFRSLSAEVNNLRIVFEDIADIIEQDKSALTQRRAERLADLIRNSDSVLQDLQTELKHYSSLSTKTQKKYDILRFGFKNLSDIRLRIISTNTSLNSFYGSLSSHSHTFIRKVLLKYAKEVNMDLHEGSVLSNRTTDSLTTASGWKDICRELRDLGINPSALLEQREFIKATLSAAIENGITDADDSDTELGVLGPLTDEDRLRRESTSTLVNEEFTQRTSRMSARRASSSGTAASANPDLRELSKVTEHTDSKKYSGGVARVLRLFNIASDERLIEAADENDMHTILKLIHRGANVRVTDKWRWTALHMACYGGYVDIARVLIEHGAKIDVRTVDGETPLKLAERSGHAEVVQLIEEEVESRKMRDEGIATLVGAVSLEKDDIDDVRGEMEEKGVGLWSSATIVGPKVKEVEVGPDVLAE